MFEGLLEDETHSEIIQDLLFDMANWHSLAKLRQHTDTLLGCLEEGTEQLERQLRYFKATTCEEYVTHELQKEVIARGRRQAAIIKKQGGNQPKKIVKHSANRKYFNMNTPKMHAIGKYHRRIRRFGTTDSYSTQSVSSNHKFFIVCHSNRR